MFRFPAEEGGLCVWSICCPRCNPCSVSPGGQTSTGHMSAHHQHQGRRSHSLKTYLTSDITNIRYTHTVAFKLVPSSCYANVNIHTHYFSPGTRKPITKNLKRLMVALPLWANLNMLTSPSRSGDPWRWQLQSPKSPYLVPESWCRILFYLLPSSAQTDC